MFPVALNILLLVAPLTHSGADDLARHAVRPAPRGVASTTMAVIIDRRDKWDRAYRWSHIALGVAGVLDVHSTMSAPADRGLREMNPLVRRPDGSFDPARGVPLKVGYHAGWYLAQRSLLPRRHRRAAAIMNFALAGFFTFVAARNYSLH